MSEELERKMRFWTAGIWANAAVMAWEACAMFFRIGVEMKNFVAFATASCLVVWGISFLIAFILLHKEKP